MEKYVVDGQGFNVAPEDLEMFLQKYPNAVKYEEPGKTVDSPVETQAVESKAMGSQLESGF